MSATRAAGTDASRSAGEAGIEPAPIRTPRRSGVARAVHVYRMSEPSAWPDVHVARWAPTKRSLHRYLQMLGKMRVALSPAQPNWMFTALHPSARGFTTGPMPWRGTAVEASLDVFASELVVALSDGRVRRVALLPARAVAEVYAELRAALASLEVECAISPVPQELAGTTPFDEDRDSAEYDPEAVRRWFAASTATAGVFDAWRARFFGRTGIQLWWGALDLTLMLFNGKHAAAPVDRGYLLTYDLDAELMNVGLFCGDESTAPFFYGYISPQPDGAERLAIAPAAAAWSNGIKEWVLPYEAVRGAADPEAELRAFVDALYERCVDAAGWDRAALSYVAPPRPRAM